MRKEEGQVKIEGWKIEMEEREKRKRYGEGKQGNKRLEEAREQGPGGSKGIRDRRKQGKKRLEQKQ